MDESREVRSNKEMTQKEKKKTGRREGGGKGDCDLKIFTAWHFGFVIS